MVVHLYKDSSAACQLLGSCLDVLAQRYPGTKFVRIVSTDCIANFPDSRLPTLLLYHEGACKATLAGLAQFGGRQATPEQVGWAWQARWACRGGAGPRVIESSGMRRGVQGRRPAACPTLPPPLLISLRALVRSRNHLGPPPPAPPCCPAGGCGAEQPRPRVRGHGGGRGRGSGGRAVCAQPRAAAGGGPSRSATAAGRKQRL